MKYRQDTLDVRIILKPYVLPKKSDGGIDLSAVSVRSQAINTDKGEILMIGPNAWHDSPTKPNLKKGDKVYYSKYGAKVLQDEETNELYIICNDQDILVGYK
jgi:co-chaperonin GroES (HSP10)